MPQRAVIAHHTRGTDAGYNGWDLTIENGHVESRLYRVWPGNGIGVRTVRAIPAQKWQHLTVTYDGSSRAEGLKLYLDGELLETTILRDEIIKSANVLVDHGGQFVLGQRFRDRGFAHAHVDDLRIYSRDLSNDEVRHLCGQKVKLFAYSDKARAKRERLKQARHAFVMAEDAMNEIPVMKETAMPRETHVLARGQYDAPTTDATRVTRATFASIGPAFPKDAPLDRRGLARWVTLPENPLTSRVAVNRLWANFFGTGFVATHENLGLQGTPPTHPELLDRLASDFVKSGWDVKALCKQIALSATYQQDSKAAPELLAADPENLLHARGPSHRLSAEQIRDMALAASGLLNPERGGPPVSPYQPGGDLWRESNSMSPAYQQSIGVALHRRSLYSVWKRTAPLPNMLAFDAPTREVCTVKRSRTNTPLQALALLNDVQFIEAARALAPQVAYDACPGGSAFAALTGRPPDATEHELLDTLLTEQTSHYQTQPDAAAKLVALGDTPPPAKANPVKLAALTVTCQVILSLDAAIWKR